MALIQLLGHFDWPPPLCLFIRLATRAGLVVFTLMPDLFAANPWQVVLLGRYNGQGLEDVDASDLVSYVRTLSGESPTFVRVTLRRGRMVWPDADDACS